MVETRGKTDPVGGLLSQSCPARNLGMTPRRTGRTEVSRMAVSKKNSGRKKHDIVQVKNPKTGRYVKIDRTLGQILSHKRSEGPYKGVPIAESARGDSV